MEVLLVTDIFGLTPEVKNLASKISPLTQIVDPYTGSFKNFASDEEAYEYFSQNVGLERYQEKLSVRLERLLEPTLLIGFSVGASAVWCNLDAAPISKICKAFCFYGSQIRRYTHLQPICETHLIFPKSEKTFSIEEVAKQIDGKPRVQIIRTPYSHGFMNPLSSGFDAKGFDEYLSHIQEAA